MSERESAIVDSLVLWGERGDDPTATVYEQLFSRYPELQELFVLDTDGGVRGSMLQQAFDCILDYVGKNRIAANLVSTSRILHQGYGVPEGRFDEFFVVLRDSCRSTLAQEWTDAMEAEWGDLLDAFKHFA
jgi:hemoglobin-like flavoprotein